MLYSLTCPVCKQSLSRSDWCVIRDEAVSHLRKCKPESIRIRSESGNGFERHIQVTEFKRTKAHDEPAKADVGVIFRDVCEENG